MRAAKRPCDFRQRPARGRTAPQRGQNQRVGAVVAPRQDGFEIADGELLGAGGETASAARRRDLRRVIIRQ